MAQGNPVPTRGSVVVQVVGLQAVSEEDRGGEADLPENGLDRAVRGEDGELDACVVASTVVDLTSSSTEATSTPEGAALPPSSAAVGTWSGPSAWTSPPPRPMRLTARTSTSTAIIASRDPEPHFFPTEDECAIGEQSLFSVC